VGYLNLGLRKRNNDAPNKIFVRLNQMPLQSVFRDESKLDINYVPHTLPHRDRELRLLKEFFAFTLQSPEKMAQRVLITGNVGSGKTALSQRFGVDISQDASKQKMNLRYIHINCREYGGSLFLLLQHAVSIFHPNFPKRGYSAEELLNAFMQMLDEEKAYVILTLDEFESIIEREGSEAVYKLTRLQETRQNKPQRLSLICIMRDLRTIEQLDASTRSTLQTNIIRLEKYSKDQLADILNARVSLAFKPSTVPEDTINLIAEQSFSENGNARFAIELLWRAGKYADADEIGSVTPECARRAISSIIPALRKDEIALLGLHEKLFLLGIARLFKESLKAYVSLSEAERAYAVVCEEHDLKPNSHTQLWKYIQDFTNVGITKTKVSTRGSRGRSTLIYLPAVPADELSKELTSLLEKEKT
jgi:cell division control protein 6